MKETRNAFRFDAQKEITPATAGYLATATEKLIKSAYQVNAVEERNIAIKAQEEAETGAEQIARMVAEYLAIEDPALAEDCLAEAREIMDNISLAATGARMAAQAADDLYTSARITWTNLNQLLYGTPEGNETILAEIGGQRDRATLAADRAHEAEEAAETMIHLLEDMAEIEIETELI